MTPAKRITDPTFVYTPSEHTDIRRTFAKAQGKTIINDHQMADLAVRLTQLMWRQANEDDHDTIEDAINMITDLLQELTRVKA